jgi:hypothetical protein
MVVAQTLATAVVSTWTKATDKTLCQWTPTQDYASSPSIISSATCP